MWSVFVFVVVTTMIMIQKSQVSIKWSKNVEKNVSGKWPVVIAIVHPSCHCLSLLRNIVSTILKMVKTLPVTNKGYSHTDSDNDNDSDDLIRIRVKFLYK